MINCKWEDEKWNLMKKNLKLHQWVAGKLVEKITIAKMRFHLSFFIYKRKNAYEI